MGVAVKDKRGGWDRMKKQLAELQGVQIRIGVMGAAGSTSHDPASGLTVVDVATRNEFGLGVPQRSFLRDWMAEDEGKIRLVLMGACREAMKDREAKQAMDRAGAKFVGLIQLRIAKGIDPPNSAYTIRLKGSSTPLIDKGVLRSSITWLTVRV